MRISHYIVLFVIYSFLGWFYESFICSKIFQKKFINRGFLLGPYCPIYGTGAVLCNIVFSTPQDSNVFVIFISCAVGACIIEYITSYIMEKLFNTRWWDYSKLPFNLNGRICLYCRHGNSFYYAVHRVFVCKIYRKQIYRPYINTYFYGNDSRFCNNHCKLA